MLDRAGSRLRRSFSASSAMRRNVVSFPPVTVRSPASSQRTWSRLSSDGRAFPVPITGLTPAKLEIASGAERESEGKAARAPSIR